jgi:hypothetical protein
MSFSDRAASALSRLREVPETALWSLASVTGVNVGWWIMAIVSAITGALVAVVAVTVVHLYLKSEPARWVPSEVEE